MITNTQAQKGFMRRYINLANGIQFESSTGGKAFISNDELWQIAESKDENLKVPDAQEKGK